jgi:AmiR/NasT family two-component response regulator
VPAAIAVQNAQILAQTRRLAANLQAALTTCAVIDQAIGILITRSGISADEAIYRLRTCSQSKRKLGGRHRDRPDRGPRARSRR